VLKATVQKAFPNATVIASTLDAYVDVLWDNKDKLPVITQEVGVWCSRLGCVQVNPA
jgi:hypothetical protein